MSTLSDSSDDLEPVENSGETSEKQSLIGPYVVGGIGIAIGIIAIILYRVNSRLQGFEK